MQKILFSISLSLLLISVGKAFAQDSSRPDSLRAIALIIPRPLEGEKDLPFQGVVAASLRIELERMGMEVRIPELAALAALASAPPEALLAEAGKAGADFLFVEGYTSDIQELRVEITVYGIEEGIQLASAKTTGRIGLRLDEAITRAAAELGPQLESHIAAVRERKRAALAKAEEAPVMVAMAEQPEPEIEEPQAEQASPLAEAVAPEEQAPPAVEEEQEVRPEVEAPAASVQPEPLPAQVPEQKIPPVERPRRLEVGMGAAPFFPIQQIEKTLKIGYTAALYADYHLNTAFGILGIGGYSGYMGFVPEQPDLALYFRSLIPVGLQLQLASPEGPPLGLFLRILGGAAINISSQEKVKGRLTRVLPQFKAGAGLTVAFSRRMGLAVEFLYEMLFYLYVSGGGIATDTVMGFNIPSIYFYTRW